MKAWLASPRSSISHGCLRRVAGNIQLCLSCLDGNMQVKGLVLSGKPNFTKRIKTATASYRWEKWAAVELCFSCIFNHLTTKRETNHPISLPLSGYPPKVLKDLSPRISTDSVFTNTPLQRLMYIFSFPVLNKYIVQYCTICCISQSWRR